MGNGIYERANLYFQQNQKHYHYQFNIDNFQKLRYIEYEKIMIETEDKVKLKTEKNRKVG